jgi:hypothetical protein
MPPNVRFAPTGTPPERVAAEYALTDEERLALTPENLKTLTQEQVDQIYVRLAASTTPDGPLRGDLFFPRGSDGRAYVTTVTGERLARVLWRGKVFFRAQGILRNRIDELTILRPIIRDVDTIERMTFDGEQTWLLFPARVSCGKSLFDPQRPSIVVDYAEGPSIDGYRRVPDAVAGKEGLNVRDEVRMVRPGFYLGRAYFGSRFALNFTLLDPAASGASAGPTDC